MELLIVLPFLGTFFMNLRKRLHISVGKTLPQCNMYVIYCVVIAMLLTMGNLNITLKLELVSI